jgi:diguanylate cyclase (GGDEF)-like protein
LQRALPRFPERVGFFVFAATFLTSLVVTVTSVVSLQRYLRAEINEKFPAILGEGSERLSLWYSQRLLDIQTFSRSETIGGNLRYLGAATSQPRQVKARQEIQDYLTYVLSGFPQYWALFLLDGEGRDLLWVGKEVSLPDDLRQQLAGVADSGVSDVRFAEDRRLQAVSAAITDANGRVVGSLHALVRMRELNGLLKSQRLGPSGEVFLVGADGRYITAVHSRLPGEPYDRPLPEGNAPLPVTSYACAEGEQVVGSAMLLDGLGWTLVVQEPYDEAFGPVFSVVGPLFAIDFGVIVVFSMLALWMATSIVKPVEALSVGAGRIADGETDVVVMETSSVDEIGLLTRSFNRMSAHLHRNRLELQDSRQKLQKANALLREQNDELQEANQALEELSLTDGLTRLKNHRFFQEHLRREIACAEISSEPLVLALIDIDHFKQLNDRYGHASGDTILVKVADIMRSLVRSSDILARYGGEEFALVPRQAPLEAVVRLAEKIRMTISATEFEVDDGGIPTTVNVTVSIGIAAFSSDQQDLFNDADRALYRAKEMGRDCVVVDDGEGSSDGDERGMDPADRA